MTQNKSMKISATRGIIDAHTLLTPMTMLNYSSTKELLLLNLTLHTKLTIFTQPQKLTIFQLKICFTLKVWCTHNNYPTTKLPIFSTEKLLNINLLGKYPNHKVNYFSIEELLDVTLLIIMSVVLVLKFGHTILVMVLDLSFFWY